MSSGFGRRLRVYGLGIQAYGLGFRDQGFGVKGLGLALGITKRDFRVYVRGRTAFLELRVQAFKVLRI